MIASAAIRAFSCFSPPRRTFLAFSCAFEQFFVEGVVHPEHHGNVLVFREHEAHVHSAVRRGLHGLDCGLWRAEIRGLRPEILLRSSQGLLEAFLDGFVGGVRTAARHLHYGAVFVNILFPGPPGELFPAEVDPEIVEHALEILDDGAFQPDVGVPPVGVVVIGNVHSAGVTHLAINDHYFAVVPEVNVPDSADYVSGVLDVYGMDALGPSELALK